MEFGVFDHLDRNDLPLHDYYEARLKLIEAYEAAGFYAYHVAEHHSTPIGMAPSPTVFLSAVAQRTRRLRFGAMVYALPLHHPLRLIEEICMLDQLSGGRLEIGFGRGSSPVEIAFYGQDPANAQALYSEARQLILQGLTHRKLSFDGAFFSFKDVPMELEPMQKPYPPVWYGVHSIEAAERAAHERLNMVSLDSAADTRRYYEKFREVWRHTNGDAPEPKLGLSRFIVIAEDEQQALSAARRAYPIWHRHFYYLFSLRGGKPAHPRPAEFDEMMKIRQAIAGTPDRVREFLQSQSAESGANYLVGQFAFGDLSLAESLRSVELFRAHVMTPLSA
ncbi:MAG TPA: LLM class flavin-dependent oxidoreductase, partial [Candidatus Binatia bacterium]|nr:LLM class flavin-dependent oxidoreductase [Candidatus Binatia bacterium]